MECPKCGLVNPSSAQWCDCGYRFDGSGIVKTGNTSGVPSGLRNWAIAIHLSAFLGFAFLFGSVVGPLVLWLIKRSDDPLLDKHGRAAINFQGTIALIKVGIWAVLGGSYFFLKMGPAPTGAMGSAMIGGAALALSALCLTILGVVFAIIAAIKANQGKLYSYPFGISFLKIR